MPEKPTGAHDHREYNPLQAGKETWKHLTEIQRFGYRGSQIFADFVDSSLAALLSLTHNLQYPDVIDRLKQNKLQGPYEDEYMRIVAKYRENKDRPVGERPADSFMKAWASLQMETHALDHDVLGEIYMREINHGEHGQYFTPVAVTDMMVLLTGVTEGETVADPACGSGRFFISMAKLNPNLHFTGVDLADICAKMTVLNMWLFNLNADIYCGNSLSMEAYQMWCVRKGGYVYEAKITELPRINPVEETVEPVPVEIVKSEPAEEALRPIVEETSQEVGQQALFELGIIQSRKYAE